MQKITLMRQQEIFPHLDKVMMLSELVMGVIVEDVLI